MTSTTEAALARRLLRSRDSGILSTMSLDVPGYPFGSLTPYVMTHAGELVLQVSGIAQHTRNMRADPRVSLTVVEEGAGNKQALGRVTVLGDASPVPEAALDAVARRYFCFFPEAEAYTAAHDFSFYWIEARRVRFIGGFGQIFWVEPEAWRQPLPQWSGDEQGILDHMNTDHRAALVSMAAAQGLSPDADPVLLALDAEGTHLRAGGETAYLPFANEAMDQEAVRAEMVRLARG